MNVGRVLLLLAVLAWAVLAVSDRGGKYGFVYRSRHNVYRALRRKGHSKTSAARISNAGNSRGKRSRMAKKAAATRRRRGRR